MELKVKNHKICLSVIFRMMLLFIVFITPLKISAQNSPDLKFDISFSSDVFQKEITGRIYVMISRIDNREPRLQVGVTGVPFWGKNIFGLKPDRSAQIDESVFGYPLERISDIPPGEYFVQGFVNIYTEFKRSDGNTLWLHNDQWEGQRWNRSPGNLYSEVKKIVINSSSNKTIKIICDKIIPPVQLPADTKWVKRIKFKSKILSEFWGQPIYLGATILLPKDYDQNTDIFYPVIYGQGHFSIRNPLGFSERGSTSRSSGRRRGNNIYNYWTSEDCPGMIAVTFQHPCPYYDDSYVVNSPNVGPYDDAIMKELIPEVEKNFRIIKKPYARILTGGSTGGWISLAMQVFHPDFFGGTFSLCPDPVDFNYFQIVNIYKDKNAYFLETDWHKIDRPNRRATDGNIRSTMENENLYELVVGDKSRSGGQWDIWEAAYSPIGEDGYPKRIWDKRTGAIDLEVGKAWEKFDLRIYLEENWDWLGPKLVGKLHIYTGSMDSYYLNNGVVLLENFLKNTKNPYYDGVIKYGEREPHCWGPRGEELIELMADLVTKNSPDQGNSFKLKIKD